MPGVPLFIHPKTKKKIEYAISVNARYAGMMQKYDVEYITPDTIGFHPVALSDVVAVLGSREKEDSEGDVRLLRWGGPVLGAILKTQKVVSFSLKKMLAHFIRFSIFN
jgi:hypothetical protein